MMDWTGRRLESDSVGRGRAASSPNELKSLAGARAVRCVPLVFWLPGPELCSSPSYRLLRVNVRIQGRVGEVSNSTPGPRTDVGSEGQLQHLDLVFFLHQDHPLLPDPSVSLSLCCLISSHLCPSHSHHHHLVSPLSSVPSCLPLFSFCGSLSWTPLSTNFSVSTAQVQSAQREDMIDLANGHKSRKLWLAELAHRTFLWFAGPPGNLLPLANPTAIGGVARSCHVGQVGSLDIVSEGGEVGLPRAVSACSTCHSLSQTLPPSGHLSATPGTRRAMLLEQQPLTS